MKALDDLIFGQLNDEQQQAVRAIDGPVLILAGAGSGKTRALTHRIAFLMQQGVMPWQILAVTFTNKAANEMKDRIKRMLHLTEGEDLGQWGSHQAKLPVMGTFHSICVRILRRDIERLGRDRSFVIYDTDDQEKLMKQTLKELRIEEAELKPRPALGYISRFKSEALSPTEAGKEATKDHMQRIVQVYTAYQKKLKENSALDFDDLILETVRLFHEHPDVLDRYQETWRYLHVDEYQDTNHAQYLLINLLAQKYRNLCVIGDPDQSIYGFRGADIRNILEFEKDYKDAQRIKLERNYRSTQPILTAADTVISANPNRPEKKMWTERKEGPNIIVQEVSDERREAEEAIKAIMHLRDNGVELREQVILYRTHAQSRLFEEACMRNGLPYRLLGGVKFYARKEVKDVVGYLHVILNPYDTVNLLRVLNIPSRKIGDTTLSKIQAFASEYQMTLWDTLCAAEQIQTLEAGVRARILQFCDMIRRFQTLATQHVVSEVTEKLLDEIKFEAWLTQGMDEAEGEDRWNNVKELMTVMHKYDKLAPEESMVSFLEEVSLVSEVDKLDQGNDALTLMTLHLCKGLEFEHVVIVGCEEGLFPHSSSAYDRAQLEEERRIMYVGMTRSKTHLRLMCAQNRFLWGESKANPPSRFLEDLPDSVIERRSDDLLSAFAWAGSSGAARRSGTPLQPFIQKEADVDIEFNQDMEFGDTTETKPGMQEGSRVSHPVFGNGTVQGRRGDVVEIRFDSGQKKTFALSIAPLKIIEA